MIERAEALNIFEQRISLRDLDFGNQDEAADEVGIVASFALQGRSGLIRFLNTRKVDHQIEILLKAGQQFLNSVAIDTDRYLKGVDPSSAVSKIPYTPIPQIEAYAVFGHMKVDPENKVLRVAAMTMENSVYRLRPLLKSLLAGGQEFKRQDLTEYVGLAWPYVTIAETSLSQFQEVWNPKVQKGRPKKPKV